VRRARYDAEVRYEAQQVRHHPGSGNIIAKLVGRQV